MSFSCCVSLPCSSCCVSLYCVLYCRFSSCTSFLSAHPLIPVYCLPPACLLLAPVILFISCLHTRPPALLLDSQTFLTLYLLPVCYSKSLLSALPPVAVISCLLPTVCPSCLLPPPPQYTAYVSMPGSADCQDTRPYRKNMQKAINTKQQY